MRKIQWIPLMALLILTSCKPKDLPVDPIEDLDPLNGAQSAEFDAIVSGLGRPEQIIRIMTSKDPSWGTSDPTTTTIKDAFIAQGCIAKFSEEPNAVNKFRRTLQVSGTGCEFQLQYTLEQTFEGQPFFFEGSFAFSNEALAEANNVRGMTMKWRANVIKTTNSIEYTYKWNLAGTGKILTFANKELSVVSKISMIRSTTSVDSRYLGTYRVDINGSEIPYVLLGEYKQSATSNLSKFRVNGTLISKDAFEAYLSKLGFFVGLDSFNDAG